MDGIPLLPSLLRAMKISKKAVRTGFEWKNKDQVMECFESEIKEFKNAKTIEEKEEELGDILFSLVNVARWENIDPDAALERANKKFITRFNLMEELSKKPIGDLTFDEYDKLWREVKEKIKQGE